MQRSIESCCPVWGTATTTCRKMYLVGPDKQQSLDSCFELVSSHQQEICMACLARHPFYMRKVHQNACGSVASEFIHHLTPRPGPPHDKKVMARVRQASHPLTAAVLAHPQGLCILSLAHHWLYILYTYMCIRSCTYNNYVMSTQSCHTNYILATSDYSEL